MQVLLDSLSWLLIGLGSALSLLGAAGLLRFPDFYSRLHAASVTDSGGAWLIVIGFAIQAGFSLVTAKLLILLAFVFFTAPVTGHALMQAAHVSGLAPWKRPEPPLPEPEPTPLTLDNPVP